MASGNEIEKAVQEACRVSPDPVKAKLGLSRLLESVPEHDGFIHMLEGIAKLFASSNFLANFCIMNHEELISAYEQIEQDLTKELISSRAEEELVFWDEMKTEDFLRIIRRFKKRYLLRITLRDVMGKTDIINSMQELTNLAECVVQIALDYSIRTVSRTFGSPPSGGKMSLVGFGKLGGAELNYSSDIDIIAVYSDQDEESQTYGILGPTGIKSNRISGHEFYCKVVELLSKVLSANTEDGIAYRVDLRLRPQGQRGDAALSLLAYKDYYMNWARTWERMALIRARPVAGDDAIGENFINTIEQFLWAKTLDYSDIEDIKALKQKIDSNVLKDDIKRGYGGIREAEFFVQTFQLIYGPNQDSLRTYRIFNAIQGIRWMKVVPGEDLSVLWENYLFLRRVEHYLQMKDDRQTHSLPASDEEMKSLWKNMGFSSRREFLSELKVKRMQIRSMYNSLLGTKADRQSDALALLEGDLSDKELMSYLSFKKINKPEDGLSNLKGIRDQFGALVTRNTLHISRNVVPLLLEESLRSPSPDRALGGLESLFSSLGLNEAHCSALMEKKDLLEGIVKIFSFSSYLTRLFLSTPKYLNALIEEMLIRKTMKYAEQELRRRTGKGIEKFRKDIATYRGLEEIRLGMFFLMKILTPEELTRFLSHVADAIIRESLRKINADGFSVIAMGKLGGREITFGSDLDLIFVSNETQGLKTAETLIKMLSSYTERGVPYAVDARLRPDGSKGILVNDIEGYRSYYLNKAHDWEIQALLKARPVAGSTELSTSFISMVRDVVIKRGRGIKKSDIREMRKKIVNKLSKEKEGVDIKLGPGGIEEIEFYVQWRQLFSANKLPEVLVQSTAFALRRLARAGLIGKKRGEVLLEALSYYRMVEAILRLNGEQVLRRDDETAMLTGAFMGCEVKELFDNINILKKRVLDELKK